MRDSPLIHELRPTTKGLPIEQLMFPVNESMDTASVRQTDVYRFCRG